MNIVASLSSGNECTLYALLSSLGYHSLRTEQLETSLSILAEEDVIVRMSTAELSDNTKEHAPCVTTTIANNCLLVKIIATQFILIESYACLCNNIFSSCVTVLTN